ncbi:MAG: hypothetical protein JO048_03740, partial [Methylobacteriaceae bacterium]|nr:hypothetical protein [Methylobacteriaceae bacterium]
MLHGRYAAPATAAVWAPRRARNGSPSGYRNLFGGPDAPGAHPGDFFHGYGEATANLVPRLARCLEQPYPWAAPAPGGARLDDNPRIPAGYTYLAQLVAHDLTFLGSTIAPLDGAGRAARNLRTIALDLETIYGAGPAERPSAYCPAEDGGPRRKLRLGVVNDEAGDGRVPTGARRFELGRDLPRAACPLTAEAHPGATKRLSEVLIADPRNDDHVLVAQTAVLFHLLHNHVCDRLAAAPPAGGPRRPDLFGAARRVVGATYRTIIREDLMRRLLADDVYAHYAGQADPFLDEGATSGIPVEFSHAAFRVGHAMVQPGYKLRHEVEFGLEDLLRLSSDLSSDRLPPPWSWLPRWSHFYELDGPPLNFSRRIGPSQNRVLFTSALIPVADDHDHPGRPTGLPRRDLLRGTVSGCRKVESLVREIRARAPHLLAASRRLADPDPALRRDLVSGFLSGQPALTRDEIATVAADPPLVLFLLLEAAEEADGLRLGTLG